MTGWVKSLSVPSHETARRLISSLYFAYGAGARVCLYDIEDAEEKLLPPKHRCWCCRMAKRELNAVVADDSAPQGVRYLFTCEGCCHEFEWSPVFADQVLGPQALQGRSLTGASGVRTYRLWDDSGRQIT